MYRLLNIILILTLFLPFSQKTCLAASPGLIVLIVVDGLPAETLESFIRKNPDSALSRLKQSSAYFPEAHHASSVTMTAPGHTNIVTGNYAWRHGIVNNWLPDPETLEIESIFADGAYPILNPLGYSGSKNTGKGVSPEKIMLPTLGDFIKEKYPDANVFSVSAKDRAAIPLAGKKGTAFFYSKDVNGFVTSEYYLNQYPDWWTDFTQLNPVPSKADPDTRDQLASALAVRLIKEYWMGFRENTTDLLSISFSSLDKSHHRYGRESKQAADSLLKIDKGIGQVLEAANAMRGAGNVLTILTSDHGFLRQDQKTSYFFGEKTEEKINNYLKKNQPEEIRIKWLGPYLYVHRSAGRYHKEAVAAAEKYFSEDPLVKKTYTWQSLLKNKTGKFDQDWINLRHSYYPQRSGSLYVVQTENTVMKRLNDDDISSHGSPYPYDTTVPLLFSGMNIPAQTISRRVSEASIVPTVLELTGIRTDAEFDGRSLAFIRNLKPGEPEQINSPNQN